MTPNKAIILNFLKARKGELVEIKTDSPTPDMFAFKSSMATILGFLKSSKWQRKDGTWWTNDGSGKRPWSNSKLPLMADMAMKNKGLKDRIYIDGVCEKVKELLSEAGFDESQIKDFKHSVDASTLRKVILDHSNGKEEKRGQRDIKSTDFLVIDSILKRPDEVKFIPGNKKKLDAIHYKKKFNDLVYYVEEIRTGAKELALKTMWIKKIE